MYMRNAGFTLRKWETNDNELQQFIHEEIEAFRSDISYVDNMFGTSENYRKVLGINWDTATDELVLDAKSIGTTRLNFPCTKRNILRIGATFYDPVGWICPVVLQVKLIFKVICGLKINWDTVIGGKLWNKWGNYLNDLIRMGEVCTPRFIHKRIIGDIVSYELRGLHGLNLFPVWNFCHA